MPSRPSASSKLPPVLVRHRVHLGRGRSARNLIGRDLGGGLDGLAFRLGLALLALQEGITLQLGVDERLELKVRQLQELDGLLQLRRDDQPLALPNLETRVERQGLAPSGLKLAGQPRDDTPPIR
jgi:hypothetical protein